MKLSSIVCIAIAWFLVKFAPDLATAIIIGVVGYAVLYKVVNGWGGRMAAKQVRK